MHRDQQLPLFFRPALQEHAPERVALDAGVLGVLVGGVLVIDHPALDLECAGLRFLRRQAVMVGKVADDLARFGGVELDVVQRHHALDRLFPAFRRRAAIGNPRHSSLFVAAMAGAASLTDQRVGDGDAFVRLLGIGRRRGLRRCGRRRLLRDERHDDRKDRKGRKSRKDIFHDRVPSATSARRETSSDSPVSRPATGTRATSDW